MNPNISEEQEIRNKYSMRRMTVHKPMPCKYCHKPLQDAALHNPQWPWKRNMGKGLAAFCSRDCMDWYMYRWSVKKLIGICTKKHFSQDEIDDRVAKFTEQCKARGSFPVGPEPERIAIAESGETSRTQDNIAHIIEKDPLIDHAFKSERISIDSDKYIEEAKKMIDESMSIAQQPTEQPTEAVQPEAEEQPTIEPAQATAPDSATKKRLKRTVSSMDLEGECIKMSITMDAGKKWLECDGIEAEINRDLIEELKELIEALEEVIG